MSKYLPYDDEGLAEIIDHYGFHRIQHDCKILVGKTGPNDPNNRLKPEKLSDLMPYYSHPIFYIRMSKPHPKNKRFPLEIWISAKSYAELARDEGKPVAEFDELEAVLAADIAKQKQTEEM